MVPALWPERAMMLVAPERPLRVTSMYLSLLRATYWKQLPWTRLVCGTPVSERALCMISGPGTEWLVTAPVLPERFTTVRTAATFFAT
jgi:hypothetical protein